MTESSSTIVRSIELLEVLSEEGFATPQELATHLGVSRSSVQRLLSTLELRGFIERTPRGFTLATYMRALSDVTLRGLRSAAYNELRELADAARETALLYVIDGTDMVVLDEAVSSLERPMRVRHPVGSRVPMLESAAGIAFLTYALPATLAKNAPPGTREAESIAHARQTGHSIHSAPRAPRFAELAVPLQDDRGYSIGAIAIACPVSREDSLHAQAPPLSAAASRISRARRTDDEDRVP